MTDAELRDAAVAALKATTVSYPDWKRRLDRGQYADVTRTKWWQAFDHLAQIEQAAPPALLFGANLAAYAPRQRIPGSPSLISTAAQLKAACENGGNYELATGVYDMGRVVVRPTATLALRPARGASVTIKDFCLSPRGTCWVHRADGASLILDGSPSGDYPCLWPENGMTYGDFDGLEIRNSLSQGVLCGGGGAANWQFWNTVFHHNGTEGNQDHGIYTSAVVGKCVIANCLFYDNWAYNMHLYPNADNLIVTGCTVDGGQVHDQDGGTRGGVLIGSSDANETHGVRVYATISTNAPAYKGFGAYKTVTDCRLYDCIAYGNQGGDYDTAQLAREHCISADPLYANRGTHDYRLKAGSPAIGYADPSRHGWVPATYRDGAPRQVATIGSETPG